MEGGEEKMEEERTRFVPSLAQPRRKWNAAVVPMEQPVPVPIESLSGIKARNDVWMWYKAVVSEERRKVLVEDGKEAGEVQKRGFFGGRWKKEGDVEQGKGFRFIQIKEVQPQPEVREEKRKGKREVGEGSGDEDQAIQAKVSRFQTGEGEEQDMEPLELEPCETFFLSYALGCLLVKKRGEEDDMNLDQMWDLFVGWDPGFPAKYRVYHHFRAKGWVVRPGIKFGSDWLLYKAGPPFYHASYSVKVQQKGQEMSAAELAGLNRVTEAAAKELILAKVSLPKDLSTADCLKKMSVREILVRRWVPSKEREEEEDN